MSETPDNRKALLPCPFCGKEPRIFDKRKNNEPGTDYYGSHKVAEKISCKCGASFGPKKNASIGWNTRINLNQINKVEE